MIRTHDEIHADRTPLALVPLDHDGPETAPASTLPAEQGSGVVPDGTGSTEAAETITGGAA